MQIPEESIFTFTFVSFMHDHPTNGRNPCSPHSQNLYISNILPDIRCCKTTTLHCSRERSREHSHQLQLSNQKPPMVPFTPPPPPNHMRALFHASHNQPRYHLLPGTLPIPKPDTGSTLIKVCAAAVTSYDVANLSQQRQLFVPGMALSGELMAPSGRLPAGARVAAVCTSGAWAEYAVVSHKAVWPIETSFEEGAALAAVASASLQAVRAADLRSGELVVIAGGVTAAGCVIAQIASVVYGARVVLGVRGGSQVSVGELIGAEAVVDRERERVCERLDGEMIDAGFDTVGEAGKLAKIVKKGGRVVRVMPVGEERAKENCRKKGVYMMDVQARVDDKAVEVVTEVVKSMPLRAACGPIYGVARWVLAMEAAEQALGAGCVVIMF